MPEKKKQKSFVREKLYEFGHKCKYCGQQATTFLMPISVCNPSLVCDNCYKLMQEN